MNHQIPNRRAHLTPPPAKRLPWLRLLLVAATLYVAVILISPHHETNVLADQPKKPLPLSQPTTTNDFNEQINTIIANDTEDQIGVAVRNITTGKTDTYGIDAPFVAASTTKVLSAVTYYHMAEQGRVNLNTTLGAFPAWFQIKQMIVNSSNDSWHLISDEIGNANLQAYAREIGLDFTQGPNTMSPSSMALLLSKLYAGELLNKEHTKTLLSHMRKTNNETLIPAAVGKNITTYHKYGDLDDELHDAAVVVSGSKKYALVIYTKGPGSVANRTTLIHEITDAVTRQYDI